jgi:drug/metabolite transporter (DMT)-like permease
MLLLTVTIWALNFTVSKYILDSGLRPLPYSSLRYTAAALVFVAFTFPRERSLRIGRGDVPLVALAVVLLLVNQLSFVFALDLTTATTAALLFGTLPIFTALISRLVGIERLGRRFWIAASLSFAGVILVTAGSGKSVSANLGGDLLAVLGAATWGGYSVAVAPLMRRYSPFRLSAVFLCIVSVPLLPASPQLETRISTSARLPDRFRIRRSPPVLTNLLGSLRSTVGPARLGLRQPPAVPRGDHRAAPAR